VQKISIIPRGQALGYVLKYPEEDRYLMTRKELENRIITLLAGRAAEEVVFNEVTTGAKDDLTKATDIARAMVCNYGMSSLGTLALDEVYIRYNYDTIRLEIKSITDRAYREAIRLIEDNMHILNIIADRLLEKESIDSQELDMIFKEKSKSEDYAI
jgi:cell division protease FtsH